MRSISNLAPSTLMTDIYNFLDDHKIFDIISINLQGKSSMADVMMIASGRSQKHISVIAELLRNYLKMKKIKSVTIEGLPASEWILVDTGDIILHLFKNDMRLVYNLEKLWN